MERNPILWWNSLTSNRRDTLWRRNFPRADIKDFSSKHVEMIHAEALKEQGILANEFMIAMNTTYELTNACKN